MDDGDHVAASPSAGSPAAPAGPAAGISRARGGGGTRRGASARDAPARRGPSSRDAPARHASAAPPCSPSRSRPRPPGAEPSVGAFFSHGRTRSLVRGPEELGRPAPGPSRRCPSRTGPSRRDPSRPGASRRGPPRPSPSRGAPGRPAPSRRGPPGRAPRSSSRSRTFPAPRRATPPHFRVVARSCSSCRSAAEPRVPGRPRPALLARLGEGPEVRLPQLLAEPDPAREPAADPRGAGLPPRAPPVVEAPREESELLELDPGRPPSDRRAPPRPAPPEGA